MSMSIPYRDLLAYVRQRIYDDIIRRLDEQGQIYKASAPRPFYFSQFVPEPGYHPVAAVGVSYSEDTGLLLWTRPYDLDRKLLEPGHVPQTIDVSPTDTSQVATDWLLSVLEQLEHTIASGEEWLIGE